ncbi:aminotransferase class V-fold PLP-dependent enzyme [Campylobacter jejuni]|nr:aminotransferase class V-fold PLP-dependent enzyme [Campylobacter jejuni]
MKYTLASSTWDEKELQAIQDVIKSDMFTMGKKVAEFEKDFAKFTGSRYAVMTSSGSAANLIATAALFYTKNPKLTRGDEVIVPAVSWSTTYYPFYQYGLKLKFVDIDLETLNYNLDALSSAISDRTKMIMIVNLLGNPNDFDAINNLIKGKDIILLEDNCESMGAEYKGKQTGTFGIMGTFSTRFVLPGYNVRPVEMSGAIGVEQLKKLPMFLKHRRENAKLFCEYFQNHPEFIMQKEIGSSSWFGFSLVIRPNSKLQRKDIIKKLEENDIEYRPIATGDFTQNEVIKYFDYEIHQDLKNAKYIHEKGFFVGNHQFSISEQISLFKKVLDNL